MKATPLVCALLLGLGACRPGQCTEFRGCGLPVAQLSPDEQAAVYETAAGGAFQLSDPTLSLLIDNRLLPRGPGYGSGPTMSDDVRRTLRNRGVLKGNCQPTGETKGTLSCNADLPGYVVRFSDVLSLGKPDSVQVYLYVQKYDTPKSGPTEALRFEKVYQIAQRNGKWTAIQEGRLPKS
jgi:hypothetical protein